ncbi:hypothetical protein PL321_13930 [Caloramator sp. mosi_1]|nr:hypothetical protein [Caloramator sp. mosi_1]WDC85793.1 hypothetical protein PL321_13930 [Caloramator sp. mosi_1]
MLFRPHYEKEYLVLRFPLRRGLYRRRRIE